MSDFKLTDYAGTYKVFIPAKVEIPTGYVDSAGNNVYMLAFVVM